MKNSSEKQNNAANTDAAEEREEKVRRVRHTISAEETFTLAKDVFDIRNFIKSVYSNRAVIARRLNLFSLVCSLIFTIIYAAFVVYSVLENTFTAELEIAVYCMLGIYGALVILLLIATVLSYSANTRTVKRYKLALRILRICVRLLSIVMAAMAIIGGTGNAKTPAGIAAETLLIIVSVIIIVIQAIPLLFGGVVNLARWALAPAKGRVRFAVVLLEWYEQVRDGVKNSPSTSKIAPRYISAINDCIDGYLIPALGKRYITSISASDIYNTVEAAPEELRGVAEGVFKRVFAYAGECGYVNTDPTKAMELDDGGIKEAEKKPRRTIKSRLMDWGKNIGKKIVKSYLDEEDKK